MAPSLPGISACVFDAYGTLFDVASALDPCRPELGEAAPRLAALWREKQLAYTWLRAAQGRHADFLAVTGDALDYVLEALALDPSRFRAPLMEGAVRLTPFPEVPAVLRRLRAAGLSVAILSNGTPAMLAAMVRHAGLDGLIDPVVSVEEAGVYKPHPSVYARAVERTGVPARAIAFLSSNGWDIHGASAAGLTTVWCNRSGQPDERLPGRADFTIPTLDGLPPLLGL